MSVTQNVGPYEVIVAGDGTVEVVTVGTPGPPGPQGAVGPTGPQGPAGADAAAVIDAPGDLIVGDATGVGMRLPLGAVGDRFRIKQGDNRPSWDTGERINVRDLGAVGDGVTDDTAALAAAFAQSDATGTPVLLPDGDYLTGPIDYRCQSIIGVHAQTSRLLGKPGQDVLVLNPTIGQYYKNRGVWRDFSVLVDDSVDASAAFPTRGGVGNAGFAVDYPDGAVATKPPMLIGWSVQNVAFLGTGVAAGGRNKSCGIYTQFASLLMSRFDNLTFDSLAYGWWDDYPSTNLGSVIIARDHLHVGTVYFRACGRAWRLVNWSYGDIDSVIMHTPAVRGLEFKSAASQSRTFIGNLTFQNVMIEAAADVLAADAATLNIAIRTLVSNGAAVAPTWAGRDSTIEHWTLAVTGNPAPALVVTGKRNQIGLTLTGNTPSTGTTYSTDQVSDRGHGNQVYAVSYTSSNEPYLFRREMLTLGSRMGHVRDSISPLLGHVDPMFVGSGDLLLDPRAILPQSLVEGTGYSLVDDLTADFGVAIRFLSGVGNFTLNESSVNGRYGFRVGPMLPPTKIRTYLKIKAQTAGTGTFKLQSPAGTDKGQVVSAPIGTTYSVISFESDLTGIAKDTSCQFLFNGMTGGGAVPVDVAWIMFRPWAADWYVAGAMQGQVRDSGGETYNVRAFGAKADGVTNDVTFIQAAIDAAVAAGGGTVFLPSGTYKVSTPIQLKAGVVLRGAGSSPAAGAITTILGTAGQNIIAFPASGSIVGLGIEDLLLSGGLNGIYAPAAASYHTYVRLRDLHISGHSQSGIEVLSRIEEWDLDKVTVYGGQYGFRYNAPRMDKCTFTDVECKAQTVNGVTVAISEYSAACTWINLRLHNIAQHAFVQSASAGAVRNWVFLNPYVEGTGSAGKSDKTTGSITTGTTALTVASGTAFANGDPLVVAGAGTNGADLITTVASGGGTVNLVTAVNAGTTVTAAEVINAQYDEFNFGALIGGVSFVNGSAQGDTGGGHVRYGIYAAGVAYGLQLLNYFPSRPVYDPLRIVENVGRGNVRQPNNFLNYNLTTPTLAGAGGGEFTRTLIPSPPGKDLVLALRDSTDNTSGTYGNLEVRKNDANKTAFIQANGASMDFRTRYRILEQGMSGWATITAGTTTPDVANYSYHKTANTGATTITNFLNGVQPQTITIHCTDGFTTIANNATIATNTGANKLLVSNRIYRFTLSGTVWIEDA